MMRNHLFGAMATIVLAAATSGCGQQSGTISGNVSFQDKPISIGTIAFISQDGIVASGTIENGIYTVEGVEVGPNATVTVTSHVPSPMMHPPTGPVAGAPTHQPLTYVPIPDRYSDPKQSGLVHEVIAGPQTRDFDLQP